MALNRKKKIILLVVALLVGGAFFFLRGPYMSNFLKALILPEAQSALGLQVIAQKMHANLFPLYIEAREVKAFNDKGERAFDAESVKAYIGLSGIFRGQIAIDSIVLKEPRVWLDKAQADGLAKGFKKPLGGGGKNRLELKARTIVLKDGEVSYHDPAIDGLIEAKGLDAEIILRERPVLNFSAAEVRTTMKGWPEVKVELNGNIFVDKDSIEFKRISADVEGSTLSATGRYAFDKTGVFRADVDILVDTVKSIADLKEPGYGSIHARGTLTLAGDLRDPLLDFGVNGDFYLQTLLEVLKAKPGRRLTGLVSFDGRLSGRLADLKGTAEARLKDADLYSVEVDDLACKVSYEDKMLRFTEGKAEFYGGKGNVAVSFPIPHARPYTVEVDFSGVDSTPAFDLIGLEWLDLPNGKVTGRLFTSGDKFAPAGWAAYEAREPRADPIGRVVKVTGKYRYEDKVVTLTDMEAISAASRLVFGGTVDTRNRSNLDFKGSLVTKDIKELTTPYFGRLGGSGEFYGSATGPAKDPIVKGRVEMRDAFLDEYPIGNANGEVSYRKNLVTLREVRAVHGKSSYRAEGEVAFPNAQKLLDFKEPEFNLSVGMDGADLGGLLKLHALKLPIGGTVDAELAIKGSGTPTYSGTARVAGGSAYGLDVSRASFGFSYNFDKFSLKDADIKTRDSELLLGGSITKDGVFEFKAKSGNFLTGDVLGKDMPLEYRAAFEAEGRGTLKHPEIDLRANLLEGTYKGRGVGGGKLEARLRGRELAYEAKVLKEKMALKGRALLEGDIPWSAEAEITKGRLDFLASSFLKEVPEDMMLGVTGKASFSGTRKKIKADATLTQMTLAMFGQSFSSVDDIVFSVDDGKVSIPGFGLRSGNAFINVKGSLDHGKYYDLLVDGTSSLAPLKAFSDRIDLIRGNARFVVGIRGDWDKPGVNGGIDVGDGAFGIVGVPQRLAAVDGYAYFDGDAVVIQRMDAKLGGGDVELSGVMRLDGFRPRTVNLDMLLKDVDLTLTKGFKANLGGNLTYRGTPESKSVVGEVAINRAEYRDSIEWRSWLLKVRRAEAGRAKKGPLDDIKLGVRIYGDKGITLDNNMARAGLKIDAMLRGTVGEPLLLGRVEATEGKVFFRNSEFRIAHATADFSDTEHRDPYVDIAAETTVKGYRIWLALDGRLDQLDMTLVSDPELEDVEILALLTVGEFGEKLKGLEGGIGAAEASSVLTGQFQEVVEDRLRELTGVSRFTIDPYVSRKTGTILPRVTVSKRLAGENLFVTYSSSMSTSEEQELKLEYSVNKNVSLLGGQDDRGIIGGDVRFRFFFK